jgi:hypothetical protein
VLGTLRATTDAPTTSDARRGAGRRHALSAHPVCSRFVCVSCRVDESTLVGTRVSGDFGLSCRPARRLANEGFQRDGELAVQCANHRQREPAPTVQDLGDARSRSEDGLERLARLTRLLQPEFDRLDGVRRKDGSVRALVGIHERTHVSGGSPWLLRSRSAMETLPGPSSLATIHDAFASNAPPSRTKRNALREVDHSTLRGSSSPKQQTAEETICPTITIWNGGFSPGSAKSTRSAPVAFSSKGAHIAAARWIAPTSSVEGCRSRATPPSLMSDIEAGGARVGRSGARGAHARKPRGELGEAADAYTRRWAKSTSTSRRSRASSERPGEARRVAGFSLCCGACLRVLTRPLARPGPPGS